MPSTWLGTQTLVTFFALQLGISAMDAGGRDWAGSGMCLCNPCLKEWLMQQVTWLS